MLHLTSWVSAVLALRQLQQRFFILFQINSRCFSPGSEERAAFFTTINPKRLIIAGVVVCLCSSDVSEQSTRLSQVLGRRGRRRGADQDRNTSQHGFCRASRWSRWTGTLSADPHHAAVHPRPPDGQSEFTQQLHSRNSRASLHHPQPDVCPQPVRVWGRRDLSAESLHPSNPLSAFKMQPLRSAAVAPEPREPQSLREPEPEPHGDGDLRGRMDLQEDRVYLHHRVWGMWAAWLDSWLNPLKADWGAACLYEDQE